jgi:hypothetical protein
MKKRLFIDKKIAAIVVYFVLYSLVNQNELYVQMPIRSAMIRLASQLVMICAMLLTLKVYIAYLRRDKQQEFVVKKSVLRTGSFTVALMLISLAAVDMYAYFSNASALLLQAERVPCTPQHTVQAQVSLSEDIEKKGMFCYSMLDEKEKKMSQRDFVASTRINAQEISINQKVEVLARAYPSLLFTRPYVIAMQVSPVR